MDSANRVKEVSETNNTLTLPVTVNASDIDLTITNFTYSPANPVQGENTQFSVTIKNLGNTPATNFELSVNPDAFQISSVSLSTQTVQINSLAGGASQVVTFDFQYPEANNFRAIAEVDAFHNILETNEANNKALADLVVSPGSVDLDITSFTLSTDLCAQAVGYGNACSPMLYFKGSTVTAAITVKNNGTYPADSFVVQWLPDDTKSFGKTTTVPGLLPGASTTVYLQSSYSKDGPYESLATVDLYNQVPEPCGGCENNNTATANISVLPRDISLTLQVTQFHVFDDLDSGLAGDGEWNMWLIALDSTATCTLDYHSISQDLEKARCFSFYKEPDGSGDKGGDSATMSLTLTETTPLVIALTGVEDDSPPVTAFDFPGYAYAYWLPGDYVGGTVRLHGQGGDSRCGGGECFWADVSITLTKAPPPPSSVSIP